MKKMTLFIITLAGLVACSSPQAANETKEEQAVLEQLLQALAEKDYEAFLSNGTTEFRENISEQAFDVVSTELGDLIGKGYTVEYIDELHQKGHIVHLWKITYRNSRENTLAKLVLVEGKTAGFWLL